MKFIQWLGKMLSERNGVPSFSRSSCGLMVVASIVWVSYIVYHTHALPAHLLDLTALFASLYGINKATSKTDKGSIDNEHRA
jgi:hypothetical protein